MNEHSIAARCLALSGLFETELLLELMLRFWKHPLADDSEFRNQLLELAVELLRVAVDGHEVLQSIPPEEVNLVLAIWAAESNSANDSGSVQVTERIEWLERVKHAIPSCFASQDYLE